MMSVMLLILSCCVITAERCATCAVKTICSRREQACDKYE